MFKNVMGWIWGKTIGWKRTAGIVLLEAVGLIFSNCPEATQAVKDAINDPTTPNIALALAWAIIATGVIDDIRRRVSAYLGAKK